MVSFFNQSCFGLLAVTAPTSDRFFLLFALIGQWCNAGLSLTFPTIAYEY